MIDVRDGVKIPKDMDETKSQCRYCHHYEVASHSYSNAHYRCLSGYAPCLAKNIEVRGYSECKNYIHYYDLEPKKRMNP